MSLPSASKPRIVWAEVFELVIAARSANFVEIISDLFARQPGELFWRCGCQFLCGVGAVFRSDACVGVVVPYIEFVFQPVLR